MLFVAILAIFIFIVSFPIKNPFYSAILFIQWFIYSIDTETFIQIRDWCLELFPTEKADLFYEPRTEDKDGEVEGVKGWLYNHYKTVREDLRDARILKKGRKRKSDVTTKKAKSAKIERKEIAWIIIPALLFPNAYVVFLRVMNKQYHIVVSFQGR